MSQLLVQSNFEFICPKDKAFVAAFDREMNRLGYASGGEYIRRFLLWKIIVCRLYLSDIDKHRAEIEGAPPFIQEAFIGDFPSCDHCHDKTECIHQKLYMLGGAQYEICDGKAFWFFRPCVEQLSDFICLFATFYTTKKL